MPTEEMFDSFILPDAYGSAAGQLLIGVELGNPDPACEPDWLQLQAAYARDIKGFGLALAQAMFIHPGYEWTLRSVALQLGASSRSLQTALFRCGYSYESALHRCRRLHAMLERGHSGCFFTRVDEPENT